MDIKGKILKLLRLARGREAEPEGKTAQKLADDMMAEHGITIDIAELDEDESPDVDQTWVVEAASPIAWAEMLLVSLCDIIYGGVVMPMIGPGGWRLYVVSDRDTVDIDLLTFHFEFLQQHIDILSDDFEEILLSERRFTEHRMNSFCLGVVYGITELLFEDIEGRAPSQEDIPFMFNKALIEATQDEVSVVVSAEPVAAHIDRFRKQVEANNEVFQKTAPPKTDAKTIEIRPDWNYFEYGRQAAHHHIDDVFPPEEEEQTRQRST